MNKYWQWLLLRTHEGGILAVLILIVLTIVRNYVFEPEFRRNYDYLTPCIYLFLIVLVYKNIFYKLEKTEDAEGNIVSVLSKNNNPDPNYSSGSIVLLLVLILFSFRSFLVFGELGAWLIMGIIVFVSWLNFQLYWRKYWKALARDEIRAEGLLLFLLPVLIVGMIYFAPFRSIYVAYYGTPTRNAYFEKETYSIKSVITIERYDGGKTYHLPADIEVVPSEERDDVLFSIFYAFTSIFGNSTDIRSDRVRVVYFNNGGRLYFNSCEHTRNSESDFICTDQDGESWNVILDDY